MVLVWMKKEEKEDDFFFLRILSIFNTHVGRGKKVLKKLTVLYIQKDLRKRR